MPSYSLFSGRQFKLVVLLLIGLIVFQIFRLLQDVPTTNLKQSETKDVHPQSYIVELENENYNSHLNDKLKIRVYYEALCPDSKHFFMRHLGPVSEKLSDYLDIALVPYGKATTIVEGGKYFFSCQHGEIECYANKIHGCSIAALSNNTTLAVAFTECMISDNLDPDAALERCSKSMNIDSKAVAHCAKSEQGSFLLKKHGDDTHLIKPTFIPTITINGSKDNQAAILKNFLLVVCKQISIPLPPSCL